MSESGSENSVETAEAGRGPDGERLLLDRRLYCQFLAFGGCSDARALARALESAAIPGALYDDLNDPRGVGLLTFSEEPDFFIDILGPVLRNPPFDRLRQKEEMTMFGRTYARGYEQDLEQALIERPKGRILDPQLRWVVWYPLRRSGAFESLADEEQRSILAEHGAIGHAFGRAGHAHDVRLDSHGLNRDDNDFVIGVLGKQLHPLSMVVQRMRKTRQTSQYLTRLGPFFTGRVLWQSAAGGNG